MKISNKHIWIGAGTLLGLGIIGAVVLSSRKKKKDEERSEAGLEFREQVERELEPEKITEADLNRAFSSSLWEEALADNSAIKVISQSRAKELAEQIFDAWGESWYNPDDVDAVYAAFDQMKARTDVSRVAEEYKKSAVAGVDLYSDLDERLFFWQLEIVEKKVGKLPTTIK